MLSIYEHCQREGIKIYGGGQGELGVGRGQLQYLASLFHPDTPERHRAVWLQRPRGAGRLAGQSMEPSPSATGFRWAESG